MARESTYERALVGRLQELFPGCVVLKNDAARLQGIPDRLVLYRDRWAMLETKASADADYQPNQQYYINMFNDMSFADVIYPEIEERVLDELYQAFGARR